MTALHEHDALTSAVADYLTGRLPLAAYVSMGMMRKADHGYYEPVPEAMLPCCRQLTFWAALALPRHFASAKHLALAYGIDHVDLLRAADEERLQRYYRRIRAVH